MKERRAGEITTFETRRESEEKVDKEKRYQQIVEILHDSNLPMTAKEIAVEMKRRGFTPVDERNMSAPRLTELSIKGIVEPVGKKRCQYSNKTVTMYSLTNLM